MRRCSGCGASAFASSCASCRSLTGRPCMWGAAAADQIAQAQARESHPAVLCQEAQHAAVQRLRRIRVRVQLRLQRRGLLLRRLGRLRRRFPALLRLGVALRSGLCRSARLGRTVKLLGAGSWGHCQRPLLSSLQAYAHPFAQQGTCLSCRHAPGMGATWSAPCRAHAQGKHRLWS